MSDEIIINAFDMNAAGQVGHGLWRHPESKRHHYREVEYWIKYAQLLERGKIDGFFFADSYGRGEVYKGSSDTEIKHGIYFPGNDPFVYVAAMAGHTTNLTFIVSQSTSFEPPFTVCRKFSSLDHLTNGKIGWNIVTSTQPSMAKNHNQTDIVAHDDRYDIADEFMEVAYKLFEQSWSDGYAQREKDNDALYDPSKVRKIHHVGRYFRVEGPFSVEPSPQRTPLLFQAGNSPRGQRFAARHAEVAMIAAHEPAQAKVQVAEVRRLAEKEGRDPSDIRFVLTCVIVADESDRAAHRRIESYRAYWSEEAALATSSAYSGYDLAAMDPDSLVEYHGTQRHQTGARALAEAAAKGERVSDLIRRVGQLGGQNLLITGGPETVADCLEEWVSEGDLDGFNVMPFVATVDTEHLVGHVIPELQRRGRFKTEYPSGTLRERVFPGRGPLLPAGHYGAQFRESAVERVPR